METRVFTVDAPMRKAAREVFASRVRLKVSEQSTWFGLGSVHFTVTGPPEVIDDAGKELAAAINEWWSAGQW